MATKGKSIRFPQAAETLIEAEAERTGKPFSQVVIDAVMRDLGGHGGESAPAPRPAPRPPLHAATRAAPVSRVDAAKAALAEAEARAAGLGRGGRAMEAAGVMVYDPSQKRPQYQKGTGGAGKAKGRR